MTKVCSIHDCEFQHKTKEIIKGLCTTHYARLRRHGDPTVKRKNRGSRGSPDSIEVGLVFGKWTIVGTYVHKGKNNDAFFPCKCECGTDRLVRYRVIRESLKGVPTSISCGCHHKEVMKSRRKLGAEPGTKLWEKARWLKQAYGMALDDYEQLLINQNNSCKICLRDEVRLHIDHCHSSGKVRGLLCTGCNTGLGSFREDKEAMLRAIQYLNEASD